MKRWLMCLGVCLLLHGVAFAESVTVFAASSLTSVLQDLSKRMDANGVSLRLSFGSSSTLAKQIALGAPADIYFSANVTWMDYLAKANLLVPDTRVDLLSNALVVVAPTGEEFSIVARPDFDFAGSFMGRLAMGDPSHVPAGMYAQEALEKLGWWSALKDRLAPANDVRGALTLVARGECSVGIVYATDAAITDGVTVIATLPDSLLSSPIVYPVSVVKGRLSPAVKTVMDFFPSPQAQAVFERYGFRVLQERGP